jgi:4-amino-4-deoxy-L-arabinose transferase-like glycosyltransferase
MVEVPQREAGSREGFHTRESRWTRWAILISILGLLSFGGYAQFFNPDEGRYSAASLEMARGFEGRAPDWVVPHLNGVPRLNKPPLVYWTAAASFSLFGATEAAGRLPSMLAALGVMGLLWWWGRRAFGERTGLLAALIWATAIFPFGFARILNTDMLLCASTAMAMAGVWMIYEVWAFASAPRRGLGVGVLVAGVGMGLALLAKGPVGIAFPLGTGLFTIFLSRQAAMLRRPLFWAALLGALLLAALILLPWAMAIAERVPGFWKRFLLEENVGRFSGNVQYHKPSPIGEYIPIIFVGMLPWSPFVLAAWHKRTSQVLAPSENLEAEGRRKAANQFLVIWALLVVGVFSLSSVKLFSYVLPAFPALCLLMARVFVRREIENGEAANGEASPEPASTWGGNGSATSDWSWRASIGLSVFLHLLLSAVCGYYLLSNRSLPRSEGLPFALGLIVVGVLGAAALLLSSRARSVRAAFWTQWGWAVAMHLLLLPIAGRVAIYEDGSGVLRALSRHLEPDDRLVLFQAFQPAGIFYAGRPVDLVDFRNNSGLDEEAIKRSPHFVPYKPELLEELAREKRRTFVFMRRSNPEMKRVPPGLRLIARSNDFRVFSNRPAPEGFVFDYVAPRKRD